MKKTFTYFALFILLTIIGVIAFVFIKFTSGISKDNFYEYKTERQEIVTQILNGTLEIQEKGVIILPQEKAYLSDTGKVRLEIYNGDLIIYFLLHNGMLGGSKGYFYLVEFDDSNIMTKAYSRFHFVNVKELEDNWYSCSTED